MMSIDEDDLGNQEQKRLLDDKSKPKDEEYILRKVKSDYISEVDRETLAEGKQIFWSQKTFGLIGMGLPFVEKKYLFANKNKAELELLEQKDKQLVDAAKAEDISRKLRANNLHFLEKDGVFTAGQEDGLGAINIRRLEQSLIADEKYYFFDNEGELIADREFLTEKMQKLYILDYEENSCLAINQRSAILCSRVNQNKGVPFKLEIYIGVLQFTYHPLFSREDCLVSDMRYLIKKYKTRADLALLPHYKKTKDILQKELSELQNRPDYPKKEMQMLKAELDKTEKQFDDEKKLLQNIMDQIYALWEKIKSERKTHDYVGSPYKLVVRQYVSNENTNEIEFVLQSHEVNQQTTGKGQVIPRQELGRRNAIHSLPIVLQIIINNQVVAKTEKKFIEWPTFQVRFQQKLEVYVFTKPSTIKIKILQASLIPKEIDTIEVELPGDKSKTITSAGVVLKEAYFARGREGIRKTRYTKLVVEPPALQLEQVAKSADQFEFEGYISYRTEWPDRSAKMPPDSMDMQYQAAYQKFEDEEEEELLNSTMEDEKFFDVNDPRNEFSINKMVISRQDKQDEASECQVPFANQLSYRQKLLKLKFITPELSNYQIPMMQDMIRAYDKLFQYIELNKDDRNYEKELSRQQQQGGPQILEPFISDEQTKKRLLEIQGILNQRKIEARLKHSHSSSGLLNLENVVNEFHFEAAASMLAECFKQIFTKRRKLSVQKRSQIDKKNVSQIKEVTISVLVIQANNVPIRCEALEQLHSVKQKIQSLQQVKEMIDQLYKLKKVSPCLQLRLDLDSKNVFIIDYIEILKDEDSKIGGKESDKKQQEDQRAFGEDSQQLENEPQKEELIKNKKIDFIRRADYRGRIKYTSEVEGINPEWNELIDFIIGRAFEKDSFDPSDVINSRNKLVITLYDQIGSFKQEPDNIDRFKLILKRHYLGSVTIPLLSLFQNEKISGTFRIQRPIMMINYQSLKVEQFLTENIKEGQTKEQALLHKKFNIIDPHLPTTIDITMTLDPPLKIAENFASTDYFPGAESTNFFLYGVRKLEYLQNNQLLRRRNIKFWAENLRGESVYLPRYLKPLQPPQMDYQANAIEKAARFVSLIPFKNDTEHFQDLPDIYCDGQEFIDLRAGDFEEHAILLCCYFMYIDQKILKRNDIKSYVVMGKGLPEGNTQYVLRRQIGFNIVELWNPQTGEPFVFQNEESVTKILCFPVSRRFKNMIDVEDQACPLKSIGCVFDDKNIYINIQKSDDPAEISFNIDDPKKWEPFLTDEQMRTFFVKGKGLESIQRDLIYDKIDVDRANEVQAQLEIYLQKQIEDHRAYHLSQKKSSFTTRFVKQRYAELTTYIRDVLLFQLESFKFRIRTSGLAKNIMANPQVNQEKKKDNFQDEDPEQQGFANEEEVKREQEALQSQWDYGKSLEFLYKNMQELMKKKDKSIKDGKEIYGFPLNFTYMENLKAWDEIKATGIADILSDDIEFICIVKCYPYPHYLISTWVFIAVLFNPNSLG